MEETNANTQKNQSTIKIIMSVVIFLVVVAGIALFLFKKNEKSTESALPKPVVISTKGQPTLGSSQAKIHIIAFEDLKCSNCARFNNTLFPKIRKKYINTGIAKYTMINLAFIPGSLPAANAARCVYEQNKEAFFPYVEYIYHNQPPENQDWATIPHLLNIASRFKAINTDKLGTCLVESPYDQFIKNNLSLAAKLMNGQVATPTIYVNGILVSPLTMDQFKRVISSVK